MINKHIAGAYGSFVALSAIFLAHLIITFGIGQAIAYLIIMLVYIAASFVIIKKKNVPETAFGLLSFLHITLLSVLLAFTFFSLTFMVISVIIISVILLILRVFSARDLLKILFMLVIVSIVASTSFQPAVAISAGQGTVLSDNWWNALNWIKNNTAECAVVATYWDPGHFITGIAKRPVVFDGASQNSLWNTTAEPGLSHEEAAKIAGTEKFRATNISVNGEPKTLIETARIQDIATTLASSNETQAIEILHKYRKEGCDEMYYLATSDLIGKSFWWTYFWSWNPVDKGCATPMSQLDRVQARPSTTGGITYVYQGGIPAGCNAQTPGQVIINQQNETLQAFVLKNNQLEAVEQLFYFTEQNGILRVQADAPVKGLVFLDPGGQTAIFIPPEISNAMFTKMFFFNGEGLENFEYVNSWGGEVKLFRIRFDQAFSSPAGTG